jgi:predicted AlkP superfamily phosphohydrolase/phosphomutase
MDEAVTRIDGRRRCFSVPNNDAFGAIRVNVAGRDPRGTIRPGPELETLCESLTRDLLDLVNPASGRPAIRTVLRSAHLYDGPNRDDLPDLLVEWNQEAPVEAVSSAKLGLVERRYDGHRTGDHRAAGLFLATGPGIARRRLDLPVSIMDFAPTICALLEVEPRDMDGRPIGELCRSREGARDEGRGTREER